MAEPRLSFVWSDYVAGEAAAVFAVHARRIRERLPQVEIRHHGSTSVPGLLTSGDVDLHVRADEHWFEPARELLSELYEPLFADEWDSEVAYFVASGAQPPVEIVLTLIGSVDDLYHGEAWQRIMVDHGLAERYNALKREHEGGSLADYKAAKRDYFHKIVRVLRGIGPIDGSS
jgi:DNA-binding transcriptional LysR family regulator